jgi:hypothetical protein
VLLVIMAVILAVWCYKRRKQEESGEVGSTVGVSGRMVKADGGGDQDF